MHRLRLAVCLALGVLACGLLRERPDPVVDGWPVGDEVGCRAGTDCVTLIDLAPSDLDHRLYRVTRATTAGRDPAVSALP